MKTVNDLVQMLGVTRKQLRGYDSEGILHPSIKPGGNKPWLYTDDAVALLGFILMFDEAGYSRSEIKEVTDQLYNRVPIEKTKQDLLKRLKEKRKRMDGMIRALEISLENDFPAGLEDWVDIYKSVQQEEDEYIQEQRDMQEILSDLSERQYKNMQALLPYLFRIMEIGVMKDRKPDSEEVQEKVNSLFRDLLESGILKEILVSFDKSVLPEKLSLPGFVSSTLFWLQKLKENPPEIKTQREMINSQEYEFILQAIHCYSQLLESN